MSHTYKSEAKMDALKGQLRDALSRLLACGRRVDSAAQFLEARGGPRAPASCEEMLKEYIKAEFKHARLMELAEQGIGTRRSFL